MTELTKPPKKIWLKDKFGNRTLYHLKQEQGKVFYQLEGGWEAYIHKTEEELLDTLNKYRDTFEIVEE